MSSSQLNDLEYNNYIKIDHNKHLLVEGRDDSRFFQILFEEFLGPDWQDTCKMVIDKAESLSSPVGQPLGNREKVEWICSSSTDNNLLGFVDREFRNFETLGDLIDQIQDHRHINRLIWSRGHSVENYFFDLELLRRSFQDACSEDFQAAFMLFRDNMDSYLRTACLLSLIGLNYQNNFRRIEASINWSIVDPNGDLDINSWQISLSSVSNFTPEEIGEIFNSLPAMIDLINRADMEIVKWLCHGHIGFKFLWNSFAKCVFDVTQGEAGAKQTAAQAFLSVPPHVKLNLCGRSLAQSAIAGAANYPSKVFELFDLITT